MKGYTLKGQLKPLEWFLENGWIGNEDSIIQEDTSFGITYEELESELNLKEITDSICNLELEDENGTQYMKAWFEFLEENL